jgi:MFS family permease
MMFLFSGASTITGFVVGSAIIGICYGSCLSLFPSACGDYWGTKNLGLNYGILFTAYGIGGIFGPILAGKIADASGNYSMAYTIAAGLMILAAVLTFFTKAPAKKTVPAVAEAKPAPLLQAAD